ncbi:hypothetical protein HUG17_0579 [Dermatophagoides farinae]|nr:hypothetical protein HUG17_0579 [Dermatophagoides farinae]
MPALHNCNNQMHLKMSSRHARRNNDRRLLIQNRRIQRLVEHRQRIRDERISLRQSFCGIRTLTISILIIILIALIINFIFINHSIKLPENGNFSK